MTQKRKRIIERLGRLALSLVLTMMLALAMCPALSLPVYAADEQMNLGATDNPVWHEKGGSAAGGVTKIGIVRRDTYRYKQKPVFDILLGYDGISKDSVQTSFMDGGYGSAAALGTDITAGVPLGAAGSTDIGSGVNVSMSFTGLDHAAIVRVDYIVTNSGSSAQTVVLGGTVDTCIAHDDYANISPFDNSLINGKKGLVSLAHSGEFLGFAIEGGGDVWYGQWTPEQTFDTFPNYIAKAGSEDSLTSGTYDSSMSWKWTANVPAGGSVTKSCYLGVGDTGLGDNPKDMETIGKYRVDLDANAGSSTIGNLPPSGYVTAEPGDSVALPSPARSGYTFSGWYTEPVNGSEVTSPYTPTGNTTLYAHWSPVRSTVNVNLTMDGAAWAGQTAALCQKGAPRFTLAGNAGTYSSSMVANGTYDIYINGEKSGQSVTVNATNTPVTENVNVAYSHIAVTTNLDGTASNTPGEVSLRKNGMISHTLTYGGSSWTGNVLTSAMTGSFDIYVGGVDTGIDINTTNLTKTIDFYTMTVNLTDDMAWENARVTLRESDSHISAILPHVGTAGDTATYSRIMQADAEKSYKVFVDSIDTLKTVKSTLSDHTADVTFYTATLNVTCSDLPDVFAVSLSNGRVSTSLTKGTTSVATTPFTAHVLDSGTYTAAISGASTAGTAPVTFDSENKTKSVTVYKLTFKKATSDVPAWADYGTLYVLSGGAIAAPAGPELSGYIFDGWGSAAWSKDEADYAKFSFTGVNADATVYAHYMTPGARINGYLRTNEDGTANTAGMSFRMPNFTVYGFIHDNIKYIRFSVANVSKMAAINLPSGAAFNPAAGLLTFTQPVTMAAAQQTVRDCIVVTPNSGEACTIQATVFAAD